MLPKTFLDKIVAQHQQTPPFPATSDIKKLFTKIVLTLFPEQTRRHFHTRDELKAVWESIENGLESLLYSMKDQLSEDPAVIAHRFLDQIPAIYDLLQTDVEAMVAGDPAEDIAGVLAEAVRRLAAERAGQMIDVLPAAFAARVEVLADRVALVTQAAENFAEHAPGVEVECATVQLASRPRWLRAHAHAPWPKWPGNMH